MNAAQKSLCFGLACLGFGSVAFAGPQVTVGSASVSPGQIAQIAVLVTDSGDPVLQDIEGLSFTVQLADGLGTNPFVSSADLLSGTIWSGHVSPSNVIIPSGGSEPQFQSRTLFTDNFGDFVNTNGLLARISIDTTGAAPGTYAIRLVGTLDGGSDTAFFDGLGNVVPSDTVNGVLTIVPAPGFAAFGLCTVWMNGVRRRR